MTWTNVLVNDTEKLTHAKEIRNVSYAQNLSVLQQMRRKDYCMAARFWPQCLISDNAYFTDACRKDVWEENFWKTVGRLLWAICDVSCRGT